MERIQEHFYSIEKKKPESEIAKHFNENGHNGTEDVKIHIVDFIHLSPNSEAGGILRDTIEMNWIHRLHSSQPIGLNTLDKPPPPNTRITRHWNTYRDN